ncbi:MAG: RtcB family protein [Verrucomicrobiota bacterium]
MKRSEIKQIDEYVWEVPRHGKMRVPARIFCSPEMIDNVLSDNAPQQAVNVACLPGIVKASLAMPDIHWGYGFPIGGVAAFRADNGIVSPGGVGYDINCGVRLISAGIDKNDLHGKLRPLINNLFKRIPTGVGASGALEVSRQKLEQAVEAGASWAVDNGFGNESDLEYLEEQGCLKGAKPADVSSRAWERGLKQLGTLGSGNHFLEIASVSEIYDKKAADAMGLKQNGVTVMIHCGSRGFGHQVCDDFLGTMNQAVKKYNIELPDRQLACAPVDSKEGRAYLGAMTCAVNFGFANRQVIAELVRRSFEKVLGISDSLRIVYEVGHNLAKIEEHEVDGRKTKLCVHRKGATRAFPPGHKDIPSAYSETGQPVLIPGDMGRYSYVLAGTQGAMKQTFGSACHGAGRQMSRKKASKAAKGRNIERELAERDIIVKGRSRRTLAEETSEAYKDVADIVDTCANAGISRKIAKLTPLGCIKG